jgi:hypothetical protein
VTEQVPVPEHPAPLQPTNREPVDGTAERITLWPPAKVADWPGHEALQSMPAGLLVTAPPPEPDFVRLRGKLPRLKVAVTDLAESIVTEQAPVPEQAPPQPAKTEPGDGLGDNATTVPEVKSWLQVLPQLMPAGLLVTDPAPVPALATSRVNEGGAALPTVMVREQETCSAPLVTLTTAWNEPAVVYVWFGLLRTAEPPSPKSQTNWYSPVPPEGKVPKATSRGAGPLCG